jgi:hypothetical protein
VKPLFRPTVFVPRSIATAMLRRMSTLIALALPLTDARGQTNIGSRNLDSPTCPRCVVLSTRVGQIGGSGNPDDANGYVSLRSFGGSGIVGIPASTPEVWRMTRTGIVLKRWGRAGEGPGEFRQPAAVWVGPNDSILIYDRQLGRVSVLDSSGVFRRAFRVPAGIHDLLPLGGTRAIGDGIVAGGAKIESGSVLLPLHYFRGDSLQRSFGDAVRRVDPREPYQMERRFVQRGAEVVALHRAYQYVIELWDTAGRLTRRFVRAPDWFLPFERYVVGDPKVPPSPLVVGGWMEGPDRLWVVTARKAATWSKAFAGAPSRAEGGQEVWHMDHPELYYESVAELFDLRRGTLIASTSLPFEVRYILGDGLVGERIVDPDKGQYVRLYQLALKTP